MGKIARVWTGTEWVDLASAVFDTRNFQLTSQAATDVPLTIKGSASQTANLLTVENSAGTDLVTISGTGAVNLPSTTSIGNVSSTEISYLDGVTSSIQTQLNNRVSKSGGDIITASTTTTIPLTVKTIENHSVNVFRVEDSNNVPVYGINGQGNSLQQSTNPSVTPVTIKAAPSQTAPLISVVDSNNTTRFSVSPPGNVGIIGTDANSGPARLQMNGMSTNQGFYHREVFAISGISSATEITRLTTTGSNGYRAYFKVIVTGHTGNINNGINIKEYYWDGGTTTPVQISTYTATNPPEISFNNSTNNVCIIRLASSGGVNPFNGVMMVEWMVPVDFSGSTGIIS